MLINILVPRSNWTMFLQLQFLFLLAGCLNIVQCSCPEIISRSGWGGVSASRSDRLSNNPPSYVVVHHAETPKCTTTTNCKSRVKNIQQFHMNIRNYSDIGYNFLIGGDGKVYEGRGWGIRGAHHPKFNARSVGICFIGNFQNEDASSTQMETLKKLMECGKDNGKLSANYKVIGHRQGRETSCPGNHLYAQIKKLSNWEPHPSY